MLPRARRRLFRLRSGEGRWSPTDDAPDGVDHPNRLVVLTALNRLHLASMERPIGESRSSRCRSASATSATSASRPLGDPDVDHPAGARGDIGEAAFGGVERGGAKIDYVPGHAGNE